MELARIIAMVLITLGHFVLTFGLYQLPDCVFISSTVISSASAYIPHIALYSLCVVGVNLFILISGYYQIRLTWKGLFRFIALCVFYNALVLLVDWLVQDAFTIRKLVKVFIVSKTVNWFFPDYFCLMLVSPLLNRAVKALDLKNLRRVVAILFVVNCISGFVFQNENVSGYNAYQFFFLYILGSWIRKDLTVRSKSKEFYLGLYLISSIILSLLALLILSFTDQSLRQLYYYNNPLVVAASVALFLFFTKISLRSPFINLIASTVVAVLFVQLILMRSFSPYIHAHSAYLTPLYILLIFLVAFVIEYPRKKFMEHLFSSWSQRKSGAFMNRPIISGPSKESSSSLK